MLDTMSAPTVRAAIATVTAVSMVKIVETTLTRPLECHMLDELSQHLEGAHGFRIEPSRTVLYGLCAKCADGIEHSDHTCKGGCCHEH